MHYPSSQLYLMHSWDAHTEFWLKGFSMASDEYSILYFGDSVAESGLYDLNKVIEQRIIKDNVSMLFIEVSSPIINPFFLERLKEKYGLMIVIFVLDDEFKFDWISSTYGTISDLVLTLDYVSVDRYRQSGINAHFFMHPINIPDIEDISTENNYTHKISFVGRVSEDKPSRQELLNFLEKNNTGVSIISTSGSKNSRYLSRNEMYSVFKNSLINLSFSGITTYVTTENPLLESKRGTKARHLEISAVGAFCLSEYSISSAKHLRDGKEIVLFKSKKDLLEKIHYYFNHEEEAAEIAMAASKAIKERFSKEAVGLKLRSLIKESLQYNGKDLYGNVLKTKTNAAFAHSFIGFTFERSLVLLLKGRLKVFFKDLSELWRFLSSFSKNKSFLTVIRVVFISIYLSGKTILSSFLRRFRSG